jgi:hypothetical protein
MLEGKSERIIGDGNHRAIKHRPATSIERENKSLETSSVQTAKEREDDLQGHTVCLACRLETGCQPGQPKGKMM